MENAWRSKDKDIPIRLMILRKTQEVFRAIQLPYDVDSFEDTLNDLVPKMEAELYRRATSLEEYGDPNTVRQRLERLAPRPGHVRPLEALWLQELLNESSLTNRSSANVVSNNEGIAIPSMGFESDVSLLHTDLFTRSLIQLQRYLDHYDALSNRMEIIDQVYEEPPRSASQNCIDLTCNETLDEFRGDAHHRNYVMGPHISGVSESLV